MFKILIEIGRADQPAPRLDPFGLPAPSDWPPTDPKELARLDRWLDGQEAMAAMRRQMEEEERNPWGEESR